MNRPDLTEKGFIIDHFNGGHLGIKCLDCERISHNPMDISYKYCGNCHRFHPRGGVAVWGKVGQSGGTSGPLDYEQHSEEALRVIDNMERYGGSFVVALSKCFRTADQNNFRILKTSFSNYWLEYDKDKWK